MEMTLNLTFEDGLKVVEAMKNVAIENGWNAEELDECGVIEEYSCVIDAALAAMGINISIDANPSYEDEDEKEEKNTLPTAKDDFIQQYMDSGFSLEESRRVADILFNEEEEEDEEEEEEEEEEDDDEELPSDEEVFQMIKQLLGRL